MSLKEVVSKMKRIIIVGNSGSGKTWIGRRAAAILGVPHICLDGIFWEPGGYNRKREAIEVQNDIKRIRSSDTWLAEGVFGHLVDELVPFADTLIYMDMPWEECRENLVNRGSESSRQLDPEKGEENFRALLEWAVAYDTRDGKASRNYHDALFTNFTGEKHRLHCRSETEELLKRLPTTA